MTNLGFGGATLTNLKSLKEILHLLDLAFEYGIRHYDTAPLYGQGYSEVIYGKFLKNKRDKVTLSTKFGLGENNETDKIPVNIILPLNYLVKSLKKRFLKGSENNSTFEGFPYRKIDKHLIQKSFEKSLKRLKTDYVDYYLLHEAYPSYLTEEALSFLMNLKKEGSVRQIGIGSNISEIKKLSATDVLSWDILQYEADFPAKTKEIMIKFPEKLHFHHSRLRNIKNEITKNVAPDDKGGFLLAEAALSNPNGKIIFSTRSQNTLKKNIEGFLKYNSLQVQ
jgi:aryl-alcohol dehydrogenase-like predicted oxidoreductase